MLSAKQNQKKQNKVSAGFQPQEEDETDENRGRVSPTHYFTEQMSCTLGFSKTRLQ